MIRGLAVFSILCCALSIGVLAQTPDTATVRGQVEDANHVPITDAVVTLTDKLIGLHRTVQTDRTGTFTAAGLAIAGTYDLVAAKHGFADAHLSALSLVGGVTASLHLQLNVAGEQTQIGVTGVVDAVRTDSAQFDPVTNGTQFVVPISTGGTFTSGTSQSALLLNHQYEVNDTLESSMGRHQLRYGMEILRSHSGGNSKEFGGPVYDRQFVYNPCTQALETCESASYLDDLSHVQSYTLSYGNANYRVNDVLWGLFVQDNVRATAMSPRLARDLDNR